MTRTWAELLGDEEPGDEDDEPKRRGVSGACDRVSRRAGGRSRRAHRLALRPVRPRDVGAARGGADRGGRRRADDAGDRRAAREATAEDERGRARRARARCSPSSRPRRRLRMLALDARPAGDPRRRRQRHREDDDDRQAREPTARVRPLGDRGRSGHVPRCRRRAARDLGRACGSGLRRLDPRRRPGGRRIRRDRGGRGARARRRHRRHGRPAAHPDRASWRSSRRSAA